MSVWPVRTIKGTLDAASVLKGNILRTIQQIVYLTLMDYPIFRFVNVSELMEHLKQGYSYVIDKIELTFDSFDEFSIWKEEEERTSHSWFVMHTAPKLILNYQHYYFYCNRSGSYNPRGSGKRGLKGQGMSKINASCSAYIKAIKCLKTGSVSITYIPYHYNQLGHLRLSKTTKQSVAEKLKEGMYVSIVARPAMYIFFI